MLTAFGFCAIYKCGRCEKKYLTCTALDTTAKTQDVFDYTSAFIETEGLQWEKLCEICSDEAPPMLESKSRFQTRIKQKALQAKGVHCMTHRYAFACKTLPSSLEDVLDSVVKIINFVKKSVVTSRSFKQICKNLNSEHETLLCYNAVGGRWGKLSQCPS